MKAVIVRGPGLDGLEVIDLPRPEPVGRQVLVRVRACGVCRRDVLTRRAMRPGAAPPLVLGHEIAGEVAAVGPEVRAFSEGMRVCSTQRAHVCGCCRMCRTDRETLCADIRFLGADVQGGYADHVLVEEDNLAAIPQGLGMAQAAIVACTIGTTYNAVCDTGEVKAGESVLVTGAGGLGTHAVQVARHAGAFVVAATRSPGKAALLRELGAHEVVCAPDGTFAAGVRKATGGRGADLVVDTVGGAVFHEIRRAVAVGGRMVLVGEVTGTPVTLDLAAIYRRGLGIRSAVSTSRRQLQVALDLVARGAVRPLVERELPLEEAALAHRLVEENAVQGRLVLVP